MRVLADCEAGLGDLRVLEESEGVDRASAPEMGVIGLEGEIMQGVCPMGKERQRALEA